MNDRLSANWIQHYPNLSNEPVSVEPIVSAEFFIKERERVFGRSWLVIGRVEDIAVAGDWFVKEIPSPKASVLVVRDKEGVIRAFHNTCKHRGSKLALGGSGNSVKGFACPLHGWIYDPAGKLAYIPDEEEFYKLDKSTLGLTPIHSGVWEGFIFINLDRTPAVTLDAFLGGMKDNYAGYFDSMKEVAHYTTTADINWKLLFDVSLEAYHVFSIHPIHPVTDKAEKQANKPFARPVFKMPSIILDALHRVVTVPGDPQRPQSPVEQLMIKSGMGTSFTFAEAANKPAGLPRGVNPGGVAGWSFDVLGLFPNTVVLTGRGIWVSIIMWPEAVDRTFFDIRIYMVAPKNMAQRVCQESVIAMTRDVMREDLDHVEPQQNSIESGAITHLQLCDQELAVRHGYAVLQQVVERGFPGEVSA